MLPFSLLSPRSPRDIALNFPSLPSRSRITGDMGSRTSKARSDTISRTALDKAYREGDNRAYREIEQSVHREKGVFTAPNDSLSSTLPVSANHAQQASVNMNNYGFQNGYLDYGGQRSQQMPPQSMSHSGPSVRKRYDRMLSSQQGFTFRGSPFYHVLSRIGGVHTCEGTCHPFSR